MLYQSKVKSHTADWRFEAYKLKLAAVHLLIQYSTLPEGGYSDAQDIICSTKGEKAHVIT